MGISTKIYYKNFFIRKLIFFDLSDGTRMLNFGFAELVNSVHPCLCLTNHARFIPTKIMNHFLFQSSILRQYTVSYNADAITFCNLQ